MMNQQTENIINFLFNIKTELKVFFVIWLCLFFVFSPIFLGLQLTPKILAPEAQAWPSTFTTALTTVGVYAKMAWDTVKDWAIAAWDWIKQNLYDLIKRALTMALQIAIHQVLAMVTNSIIKWIQSDFQGQPGFVTDWKDYLKKAGDAAAGRFLNDLAGVNLCSSFSANIKVSLSLPVPTFNTSAACTLDNIMSNINATVNDFYKDFQTGGWLAFEESRKPQNSAFGAYLMARDAKTALQYAEIQKVGKESKSGFKSTKKCLSTGSPYKYNGNTYDASEVNCDPSSGKATLKSSGAVIGKCGKVDVSSLDANGPDCSSAVVTAPDGTTEFTTNLAATSAFRGIEDSVANLMGKDGSEYAPYVTAIANALITQLVKDGVSGLTGMVSNATVDDSDGSITSSTKTTKTLTGTVSIAYESTTVTGAGTLFTKETLKGDLIKINGEIFTIASIYSDTNLTLDNAPGLGIGNTKTGLTAVIESSGGIATKTDCDAALGTWDTTTETCATTAKGTITPSENIAALKKITDDLAIVDRLLGNLDQIESDTGLVQNSIDSANEMLYVLTPANDKQNAIINDFWAMGVWDYTTNDTNNTETIDDDATATSTATQTFLITRCDEDNQPPLAICEPPEPYIPTGYNSQCDVDITGLAHCDSLIAAPPVNPIPANLLRKYNIVEAYRIYNFIINHPRVGKALLTITRTDIVDSRTGLGFTNNDYPNGPPCSYAGSIPDGTATLSCDNPGSYSISLINDAPLNSDVGETRIEKEQKINPDTGESELPNYQENLDNLENLEITVTTAKDSVKLFKEDSEYAVEKFEKDFGSADTTAAIEVATIQRKNAIESTGDVLGKNVDPDTVTLSELTVELENLIMSESTQSAKDDDIITVKNDDGTVTSTAIRAHLEGYLTDDTAIYNSLDLGIKSEPSYKSVIDY